MEELKIFFAHEKGLVEIFVLCSGVAAINTYSGKLCTNQSHGWKFLLTFQTFEINFHCNQSNSWETASQPRY